MVFFSLFARPGDAEHVENRSALRVLTTRRENSNTKDSNGSTKCLNSEHIKVGILIRPLDTSPPDVQSNFCTSKIKFLIRPLDTSKTKSLNQPLDTSPSDVQPKTNFLNGPLDTSMWPRRRRGSPSSGSATATRALPRSHWPRFRT